MSSKFIFDIKIPVNAIPFDEREASEICEQRDLSFNRTSANEYIIDTHYYNDEPPYFIFCIVEIQGLSVLSQ